MLLTLGLASPREAILPESILTKPARVRPANCTFLPCSKRTYLNSLCAGPMNEAADSTALTLGSTFAPTPKNWSAFQLLPCQLSLEIPIPGFTVSTLLRLAPHDVVNTHWLQGSDVPLRVNGRLIGWTEFEVLNDHLAARLTQIA